MFPLKLQKISCYLGYAAKYSWHISWRIFYFWLVWLVNLNTGSQLPQFTCFVCAKMINLLNLNWSSENLVIIAEGFLKLPNLHMLIKQKSPSLPRNVALRTCGKFPVVFSTKVNLLYLLCSTTRRCCLLYLMKRNCLLKTFLSNPILMMQLSLYLLFLSELIWNCITLKMVKKVIRNLCQRHLVLIVFQCCF